MAQSASKTKPAKGGEDRTTALDVAKKVLPCLKWFQGYNLGLLRTDLISGVTVALVLIPQSMAYAQLAGLPAYYGLYAAFLPPAVASIFGSSNQLATGPVAVVSLMTAASLEPLATEGSTAFIAYAVVLALVVGVFQFLLGLFKLGLVVNFLSHPVVNGFTNAAAIIIASSQFSKLFGVYVDKAEHHYETIWRVVLAAVHFTHWPSFALAALAISLMVGLRKLNRKIPNVLVAVVLTTVISWAVGFHNDHDGKLADLKTPELLETVQGFNQAVEKRKTLSTEKVDKLLPQLREAEEQHGERSAQFFDVENRIRITDLEIKRSKEEERLQRDKLRGYHLAAVTASDGAKQFYLEGQVPAGQQVEGSTWRLKVGNILLDEGKLRFMGGGAVVGDIPQGLRFAMPTKDNDGNPIDVLDLFFTLLSAAVIISLLGFMEAISIAKAMAAKTGQRLDPNQELIGQGLANIVGAFGQSYPVSGSFSRSAVNLQAGAVTGLSNVFSTGVVLLTLLFFTPLLYHLPQSVLASIIMMAVIGLVNVHGFMHAWKAQKFDGAISIISFVCTLAFAPHLDRGILIGVVLSVGLYLLRNMRPQINLLSKHGEGTYRAARRHGLPRCKHIAVVRFNGSLIFANVSYLEDKVLEVISTMPELKHVIIVGNGINELDASGEEMLSILVSRLREGGHEISFTGLNDAVVDVLRRTRLYERIGEDRMYGNVALAIEAIHGETHRGSDEQDCPLLHAPPEDEVDGTEEAGDVAVAT